MRKIVFYTVVLLAFYQQAFSQSAAGKIITSAEADNLFGKVEKGIQLNPALLSGYLQSSPYIFFSFTNGVLIITNERKKILYPLNGILKGDELFHVYSSGILAELLNKNPTGPVTIETRKEVLTITNGNFTLEFGYLCPPYCNYE